MSEENVELVRRGIDSVEAFWSLLDEHVVWAIGEMPLPDLPEVMIGRDAVVEGSRHYWGTWDDYVLEPTEIIDAGEDRVIVVFYERGRGRGSGVPFERRGATLYTLRACKMIRFRVFPTREEALEAAGLPE